MGTKVILSDSEAIINGYLAEGGDIAENKIVMAGTAEDQRQVCSAVGDEPLGIVSTGGYQYKGISVTEFGLASVVLAGTVNVGDLAILSSTGQTVYSLEQNPNTTDDEIYVLGHFVCSGTVGQQISLFVNPQKIKNPMIGSILVNLGDVPIQIEEFEKSIGNIKGVEEFEKSLAPVIAATTVFDVFEAPEACKITSFEIAVTASITANDTNYWSLSLINEGAAGGGSTELLTIAGDVNSTKATGGTGLTADVLQSFGLNASNTTLAALDVLKLTLTKAASGADLTGIMIKIKYLKTAAQAFDVLEVDEALTVTAVKLALTGSIGASDTNYWEVNLLNGSDDLLDNTSDANTTKTTGGAAFVANIIRSFALDATYTTLAADDLLELKFTGTGSPSDIKGALLIIEFKTASKEFILMRSPVDMTVLRLRLASIQAITSSDSSYWEFNLVNKALTGSGTDEVLSTTSNANSTKTTGGSAGMSANVFDSFAVNTSNDDVDEGEVLNLKFSKTGTPEALKGIAAIVDYIKR